MTRSAPPEAASSIELVDVPAGVRLRLRVSPGARKTAVLGAHGGALKLSVAAPPEHGKANRAVIELLATALGVPASVIGLISGETSDDKVVLIALEPAVIREALARALPKKRGR